MFSSGSDKKKEKVKLPPPPKREEVAPPPQAIDTTNPASNADAVQAGRNEQARAALAKGNTILTTPLGDTSQANIKKKELLGQ